MGRAAALLGLVLAVTAALWAGAAAESSCTELVTKLLPCLDFVEGKSDTPPATCCTALGSVINSNTRCLCQLQALSQSPEQRKRALSLSSACDLPTISADICNGTASAPPSVGKTPSAPPSPGGSPNRMPLGVFFCAVFFAVTSSFFVL